ncbi:uncharacterized protein [Panulirus ornatus]|uniref:uncharacterized protein isoform X2 n=1 Tax=Panulirus ornatus TaxID=150431 RepID=UPI003A8B8888
MPSRREGDDYIHHRPRSGDSQAPQQFTWREKSHLALMGFSYLTGLGVHISIVVDKYSLEEPPKNRGLYLTFLLLPHFVAGLKNLQYHYREAHEEEGEDSSLGWAVHLLLFPFSPLIRIYRAWRFGMAEKDDWENGIRFVDEMVTVGVLKLLEVLLGEVPTLCLLVRDDVWGRSADWSDHVLGSPDLVRCGPKCVLEPDNPLGSWTVSRMFFLLAKIAQCVVFYLIAVKQLQRLQNPEHYTHLRGNNAMKGRLNIFAFFLLYTAHFFFIGSRIMGYSMVSAAWGSWVYLIVGGHWLLNIGWHLITILNSGGIAGARSVSSLIMGGVWLITLTNEQGGRQLGRFIMYYLLAFAESAVCGYLWNTGMKGSGDFFAHKKIDPLHPELCLTCLDINPIKSKHLVQTILKEH